MATKLLDHVDIVGRGLSLSLRRCLCLSSGCNLLVSRFCGLCVVTAAKVVRHLCIQLLLCLLSARVASSAASALLISASISAIASSSRATATLTAAPTTLSRHWAAARTLTGNISVDSSAGSIIIIIPAMGGMGSSFPRTRDSLCQWTAGHNGGIKWVSRG